MLIEFKKQRNWIVFTILAAVAAIVSYCYFARKMLENGGTVPTGSTGPGLVYGTAGFLLMIFCGLLGARRAVRIWRLGRAKAWLNAHIWLGLLAFPLILCHSGFLMGHSLTLWLMILFIIVEITGIIGVMLQQYIPTIMLQMVKNESTFEQIPEVIQKLKMDAAVITACCCGKISGKLSTAQVEEIEKKKAEKLKKDTDFKEKYGKVAPATPDEEKKSLPLMNFYLEEVEPFLSPKYNRDSKLAEQRKAAAVFTHVQTLLPQKLHLALDEIQGLCEERRQLQMQTRLHWYLHSWEYIHIPLSYLLLALSAFHVVIATFGYSGVLNK